MRITSIILLLSVLPVCFSSCHGSAAAKKDKPLVIVLGLDGADWRLIDPLIQKGRLPLFKQLKEQCAWGSLHTIVPAKSPIIWTSIASGKTPAKHGIDDYRGSRTNKKGIRLPYTSVDIREPLLWDILTANALRSVVVGWYLSGPAQPLNGVNVSDNFFLRAFLPQRITRRSVNNTVYPQDRAAELKKFCAANYEDALREEALPDFPLLFAQRNPGKNFLDYDIFRKYPEFVLQDNLARKVAADLFQEEDFDFFAVYFRLADIVQHFAYDCFVDEAYKKKLLAWYAAGAEANPEVKAAYGKIADIVCPVYQNLEKKIRIYLDNEKYKDAYFVILSDHGFRFYQLGQDIHYTHVNPAEDYVDPREKAPDGILLIKGPGVRPGEMLNAKIFDIAPTVLYLLRQPLDRNMDGLPLLRAFHFRQRIRYQAYKKKKPQNVQRNREMDEKALDQLRALGYIND